MSDRVIEIPEEYLPTIEEMPGELLMVAEGVEEVWPGYGVKVALLLGQLFPGVPVYMHNVKDLVRRIRNDAIHKEKDQGSTIKMLAIKYNLSTRQIENILAVQPGQEVLKSRQKSLF